MKYSRYNSIIKVDDNHYILYSALSDQFIILKRSAYRDISENDANTLAKHNYVLYNQLLSAKGIVDDLCDEKQMVLEKIRDIDNNDSVYHLHINPTVDCNFRCWYCYEEHVKGSKMTLDVLHSVKKLMTNVVTTQLNLRTFNLSFFGGEPLMYFTVIAKPLIEHIYSLCMHRGIRVNLHFTSNGFLLNNAMIDFLRDKNACFQITLDGGKDTHDSTRFTKNGLGSYDVIINNIKRLIKANLYVILRINYTSTNIFNVSSILKDLNVIERQYKNNISVDFQKVWQDNEAERNDTVIKCLNKNIKLFSSEGFRVSSHKILDSVNDSCYGDKRYHALVNYNGDVFNCTARDFTTQNRAGYLSSNGTIVWENNSLENRLALKFSKSICHSCRIAPLCGGGCCQRALESKNGELCMYSYSETDIDQIILNRFEFMFINQD
ncbi:MAG: radical SAM protein [Bacteroidales bacterium]|nr:radical SAM protein [Bacteroidales bacterium]